MSPNASSLGCRRCLWRGSEGDETQKAQAKANSRATTYRRHFCRNPLATSLIKQVLPPEFFIVKEPPSLDADLFIVEEGLLTPTEQKILHALVELGTLKAVAEHLHYHPATVKRYLRSICRKLKVKTAPQATALAVRLGLI